MKIFGQRLKELRIEKGLSTKALGNIIEVSDMAVSRWENDKTDITSDNLVRLAKFFNVSSDYLLGLDD